MKKQFLTLIAAVLLLTCKGKTSTAQSLDGNWKGTSVCQVKNSPCYDEIVVYHISSDSSNNSYTVDAGKIVNGKEIDMGTLKFSFNAQQKLLYLTDSVAQIKWEFKVSGNKMHGTLISKGNLFRVVDLKRED
jgi:hypothetical protein